MNWTNLLKLLRDSTTIEIDDGPNSLELRSVVKQSKFQASLLVLFVIAWSIGAYRTGWGWKGLVFGGFAIASYAWNWRPVVDVRLQITRDGLEVIGKFAGGYEPERSLNWARIVRFEYRSGSGGDDDYSPSGLWAVGPGTATCLLPGVDQAETINLAIRINERFPDVVMARDTGYRGLFHDELTSLNLGGQD
jgi:hypothetical protein